MTAIQWFRIAANREVADAQYNLAVMYREGQGVPKNNKEPISWLNRAVQKGHSRAQSDLGSMYAYGIGIKTNYRKAIELFHIKLGKQLRVQSLTSKNVSNSELTCFNAIT